MASSGNVPDFSGAEDLDLRQGFAIVGAVLVFLTLLLCLRFGCNMCIDVVILRDSASLMRDLSQLRRLFCPWWHPRTEPGGETTTTTNTTSASEFVNMDRLLMGLSPMQKQELLESILTSKIASKEDINVWKTRNSHESSSSSDSPPESADDIEKDCEESCSQNAGNLICPICIQEIDIGNRVIPLIACDHVFHKECLSRWLSTHTRDCPYCRTEILTQVMLEEAYRLRQESQQQVRIVRNQPFPSALASDP